MAGNFDANPEFVLDSPDACPHDGRASQLVVAPALQLRLVARTKRHPLPPKLQYLGRQTEHVGDDLLQRSR